MIHFMKSYSEWRPVGVRLTPVTETKSKSVNWFSLFINIDMDTYINGRLWLECVRNNSRTALCCLK